MHTMLSTLFSRLMHAATYVPVMSAAAPSKKNGSLGVPEHHIYAYCGPRKFYAFVRKPASFSESDLYGVPVPMTVLSLVMEEEDTNKVRQQNKVVDIKRPAVTPNDMMNIKHMRQETCQRFIHLMMCSLGATKKHFLKSPVKVGFNKTGFEIQVCPKHEFMTGDTQGVQDVYQLLHEWLFMLLQIVPGP